MSEKTDFANASIRIGKPSNSFVQGFTLSNFLQYVEADEKSWTLKVVFGEKTGFLHFREGILVDAGTNRDTGEEAALNILSWENADISVEGECCVEKSAINLSLNFLLLEANRRKDEKDCLQAENALLERGIRNAEAHRFRQAMNDLKAFLTDHRDNAEGWVWYSRCSRNIESIEKTLNFAIKASPNDPSVLQEFEKLIFAKKSGHHEKLRRCPFCWTPIDLQAVQCGFCDGFLFIPRQAELPVLDDYRKAVYQAAVRRYQGILEDEPNINARFYLCMAQFNLQMPEDAAETLRRAVQAVPEKILLRNQLVLLEQHVLQAKAESPSSEVPENLETEAFLPEPEFLSEKRVLVVEDSRIARRVIVSFLEQNGFFAIEAEDGFQALGKLNAERPDLVLLDIILPKMDGYKVLSSIRSIPEFKDLPVIMLTSRDGLISKMKGKLAGSTAYLTKPFDPEALLKTIGQYL